MKYSLWYVTIALLLFSCGNQDQKREEELYRQVMDTHDEVMTQMGEVMRLEKQLNDNIDQLKTEDSTENKEPRIEYLTTLKNNLTEANEAMMQWMREFNNDMDEMSHEEKMNYLQQENEKIVSVEEKVTTAIDNAKEAIQ